MVKLTKKQREEKAFMRRTLILGSGAVGVAALVGGIIMTRPPEFPELRGAALISDRLERIGAASHHQQLTGNPDSLDILVIGDSSCRFCREFVDKGLDDLTDFARGRDLSLGYAAIGISPSGATTMAVAACLERIPGDLPPIERVRAMYALSERLAGDAREARAVISDYAGSLGVPPEQMDACLARGAGDIMMRNNRMKTEFEVTGTPTFIVRTKDGDRLATFNGFSGSASVVRQVRAALAS